MRLLRGFESGWLLRLVLIGCLGVLEIRTISNLTLSDESRGKDLFGKDAKGMQRLIRGTESRENPTKAFPNDDVLVDS